MVNMSGAVNTFLKLGKINPHIMIEVKPLVSQGPQVFLEAWGGGGGLSVCLFVFNFMRHLKLPVSKSGSLLLCVQFRMEPENKNKNKTPHVPNAIF